ncbi:MAG: hypothetical protein IGS54_20510 [Elainella sp. C42_A2020_010]|nr:hypothetical protein [Elainella sp. C42_A2020_010]
MRNSAGRGFYENYHLFRVKTVNLIELATAFVGKTKPESNYKCLQRSWSDFE